MVAINTLEEKMKLFKMLFLISSITFVFAFLAGCSSTESSIMPVSNGQYVLNVSGNEKHDLRESALEQARNKCDEHNAKLQVEHFYVRNQKNKEMQAEYTGKEGTAATQHRAAYSATNQQSDDAHTDAVYSGKLVFRCV
jgi:hypothetical protein